MLANWRHLSLISVGALIIKAVGLLRGVVVAGFIGANGYLDAYYGVLVIVGFFIFVFADQLEMLISEAGAKREDFSTFAAESLTTVLGVSTLMTAALYMSLPLLLPVLLPDLNPDQYLFTAQVNALITALCCIYPPYRVLLALFRCKGLVAKQVGIDSINSILFCGFTIPALYLFRDAPPADQVLALAASHSAAFLSAFCVGLILWRASIKQRIWGKFSSSLILELGGKALTLSGVHYSLYLFTFIDRFFAGRALPGGVSLLGYAGNISLTARSLINFEQIYLIDFSRSSNKAPLFRHALIQNAALSSVVGVFLLAFSHEIVQLVYQRGAFTPEMASNSARILAVYGLSTLPFLWWGLVFRAMQVQGLLANLPLIILALVPVDLFITSYAVKAGIGGAVFGTMLCHLALLGWGLMRLNRSLGTIVIGLKELITVLSLNGFLLGLAFLVKQIPISSNFYLSFGVQGAIFGVSALAICSPWLLRRAPFQLAAQRN
jgi:putative peptidoglycan lipid II flippase